MKIVGISDVHGRYSIKNIVIPECDILISCGDYSFTGQLHEVRNFHKWLNKQPAKYKISLQGNHERGVEANFGLSKTTAEEACPGVYFIDESLIEIEGLKIWCSSYTPTFLNWAFMRDRGPDIKAHWDRIPDDIDILVTHGPPYGILDYVEENGLKRYLGCQDLLNRVKELKNLKHHFFGHIHYSHGSDGIFHNCAIVNEQYQPVNSPIIVEI